MPVSYVEAQRLLASSKDRYLLLLLTEGGGGAAKVKPGIPALGYRVLDVLTDENGPLDETLTNWSNQRPSRVSYSRVVLDQQDRKTMTLMGVCWLPQVRLVRRGTILFRSSVSVGDNGEFLAQDVGGRSFRRRVEPSAQGLTNLLDALAAEVDR